MAKHVVLEHKSIGIELDEILKQCKALIHAHAVAAPSGSEQAQGMLGKLQKGYSYLYGSQT